MKCSGSDPVPVLTLCLIAFAGGGLLMRDLVRTRLEREVEMAKRKTASDPGARKPPSLEARAKGRETQSARAREAALSDELADVKRERDELAERLATVGARKCPSCGAETREGKLRPAKPTTATGLASDAVLGEVEARGSDGEVEVEAEAAPVTADEPPVEDESEDFWDAL